MTTDTGTGTAGATTPADLLAALYLAGRGHGVISPAEAQALTETLTEWGDSRPGDGRALRVLASYYTDRVMEAIAAAEATPAAVLAAAVGDGDLTDYAADAGVPAPDCAAAEALLGEIFELVTRRLCAARAGLATGGLNRILAALEWECVQWRDGEDPGCAEAQAVGRLADRISDLLGVGVAEPGGSRFVLS
jgi:hypothetical protein